MADVFRQTYANEGLRGFYKVCDGTHHAGLWGHGIPQLCLSGVAWPPALAAEWVVEGAVIEGLLNVLQNASNTLSLVTWGVRVCLLGYRHAACRCLYVQGLLPNLIKLAPAAGLSWYVFEETKLLMGVDPRT